MKKWHIGTHDETVAASLAAETGLSPFICRLLAARGMASRAEAEVFFNSDELSDPFDIKDMDKAVDAINAAVESGRKIAVYGDYDCDGITSTYMLFSYLEACGAEVCWYIPTRDEGYGLNTAAIDRLHGDGVELIITVDNGISAVDEAGYIKELGMTLVITDHHQVPEVLPDAAAIVNPHRKDDLSAYKFFAGCGVVLKLIMAMENDIESVLEQYADIAAIGTVGDIVRLDGENRIIVRRGLDALSRTENMGLMQLIKQCGVTDTDGINSIFLAFSICPRINAAGRYKDPRTAMELLLCDDMTSAANKARELCEMNTLRQQSEAEIIAQAEQQIREHPELMCRKILIVQGDGWNHGVIGIISSRLLHRYGKPNIVITREGSEARGSARSTDELPLFTMLESCSDLLIRFGGHTKAAGLNVETNRIDELVAAIYNYCEKNISGSPVETLHADMEIEPREITAENVRLIDNLEPFGEGNQQPVFLLKNCTIRSKKALKDGKYVSFDFSFGANSFHAVYFGSAYSAFGYFEGDSVDILASLAINEYNGRTSVNIMVKDVRYSGFRQDRYFAAKAAYDDYRCGRVDKRLLCRMAPENTEMRTVYDILRQTDVLSKAELFADRAGINCCKFSIILDILKEFSLAETDITRDSVKLLPAKQKADLTKSKILAELMNS